MVETLRPNEGPVDEVKYHHVGTGVTTSRYFCDVCDGWFGIPHDNIHPHRPNGTCACVPCQQATGRFGCEGVHLTHHDYLAKRREEAANG